jgi:rSAM/selenodomain-associated transferase 2
MISIYICQNKFVQTYAAHGFVVLSPNMEKNSATAKISIIIPTFNEAGTIEKLVGYLTHFKAEAIQEIIVADGGSTDNTCFLARQAGAQATISPKKGRGAQMNYGASQATGSILYFLHADSYPPPGFWQDIQMAVEHGYNSGCYQLAFDDPHPFLRFNAWFTRFDIDAVRFGDQSLFVTREVFQKAGGFREDLIIMEDQEIIGRIRKYAKFKVLAGKVSTSARKYRDNGVYKLQGIFFLIYFLYQLGVPQEKLVRLYKRLIRQNKV